MEHDAPLITEQALFNRVSSTDLSNAIDEILTGLDTFTLIDTWIDGVKLSAKLLAKAPNDSQEEHLISLLFRRLDDASQTLPSQLVLQCLFENDAIRSAFFQRMVEQLQKVVHVLQSDEDGYQVSTVGFIDTHVVMPSALWIDQGPICDREKMISGACKQAELVCSILKISTSIPADFIPSQDLLVLGLVLVGACSRHLSIAARNLVCALIPHLPLAELESVLLDRIYDLSVLAQPSSYANATARIWFQWLSNIDQSVGIHLHDALFSIQYWMHLQQMLHHGHSEERKFVLSILQLSVNFLTSSISNQSMYFDNQDRAWSLKEYEKFSVLFQTIVLGRYANQVEECLPDLESMIASGKVHRAWIETLLMSVFHGDVQESIRESVGNWYMTLLINDARHISTYDKFLLTSFLPWGTTGTWFTASTISVEGRPVCQHGERLSACVSSIIAAGSDAQRCALVNAILKYLEGRGDNIYPFASAYIFEGIFQRRDIESLRHVDLDLAYRLATRTANRGIPRDLMTIYCSRLSTFTDAGSTETDKQGVRAMTENLEHILQVSGTSLTSTIDPTFEDDSLTSQHKISPLLDLQTQIVESQYRSLTGLGLSQACDNFALIVKTNEVLKCSIDVLTFVIAAIWDETITQDYPKVVAIQLPTLFLDPKILDRCLRERNALLPLLSQILHKMYQISESRIYMLASTLTAMRRAVLAIPHCVEGLGVIELLVRFSKNPPSPSVEFLIEVSLAEKLHELLPHISYESYYGRRESYAYAAVFDLLNKLSSDEHNEFRNALKGELMIPWTTQKLPIQVVTKWKKTEQLQMMLVLSACSLVRSDPSEGDRYLQHFLDMLALEPLPRFRHLLEWIIIRIFLERPDLRSRLSDLVQEHGNPKYAASLIKIAVKVACFNDSDSGLASNLIALLVAYCASSKVAIRIEAQWSIHVLQDHCAKMGWTQVTDNPAISALDSFLRSHDRFNAPIPSRVLEAFDPVSDHTLCTLFSGNFLDIEPRETRKVSYEDFTALHEDDAKDSFLSNVPPPSIPLGTPITQVALLSLTNQSPANRAYPATTATPLQTKGLALSHPSLSLSSRTAHPLILCASLIDNPYNLGGLSRCAEIFGAAHLLVSDLALTNTPRFTSVAVTSHLHLPISALTALGTPEYLREKKREGYTVVGVEQTDQSVVLGEGWRVPRKCVLVLGSEKEGIPARVLVECDVCVEIRQEGVTRSLNVQTAAAVVLFEYQRQWGKKGTGTA